ncbi:MAG TPA: hypothetical protein VIG47_14025 [Gemmatimonadaceae bacterium]|jgi:hypothetical protein
MAQYTGLHTVFYTDKEYKTQGHIGGVFGNYHDAETQCEVLHSTGRSLATWIEKRAPSVEELCQDAVQGALRAQAAAFHTCERVMDKLQHVYLDSPAELQDTHRYLLSNNLAQAAKELSEAGAALRRAKMELRTAQKGTT